MSASARAEHFAFGFSFFRCANRSLPAPQRLPQKCQDRSLDDLESTLARNCLKLMAALFRSCLSPPPPVRGTSDCRLGAVMRENRYARPEVLVY